jgi:hypothetical protein
MGRSPRLVGWSATTINPWGYPAKDRSGRLGILEPPHLGRLFEKIAGPAPPIARAPSAAAGPAARLRASPHHPTSAHR